MNYLNKCKKHPKYNGKKKPKHQCEECLALHIKIGLKPRAPIVPSKVEKSKKEYNRQKAKRIEDE